VNQTNDGTAENLQQAERAGISSAVAATVGLMWSPSTIALMGLGVFILPLQAEFGWSRAQVVAVSMVINLTLLVMSPIQGYLVDRFGTRKVIVPSLGIFGIGLMLFYFLPGRLDAFYLGWAALVAASVGLLPGGYLRVAGAWFNKRLGMALGLVNSGIGWGNIFVPLVASTVITAYGWRMAYVALGLIVLCIAFPVCAVLLKERRSVGPESAEAKQTRKQTTARVFKETIRSRQFRTLVVAFFLLGLVNNALINQQVPMLIDAGMTPQKAAFVQSMFGVFLLLGRIGAGILLDRFSARWLMGIASIGAAIACLIYSTGVTGNLVYLSAALIGLVVGAEFDVLGYVIKRYFGMAAFGKTYGSIFSMFQLGGAIGSTSFAVSHDIFGSYQIGLYVAAAVLVLVCIAFTQLSKYPGEGGGDAGRADALRKTPGLQATGSAR
jgi:MFS family permease